MSGCFSEPKFRMLACCLVGTFTDICVLDESTADIRVGKVPSTPDDPGRAVMSYCCDRARNIAWGIKGGLPSSPHGVWLNKGKENERYLGAVFSNVPVQTGDSFTRPSAGGGGYGDPLERSVEDVLEDVIDAYVSVERAAIDYGVVIKVIDADLDAYEIDAAATVNKRSDIAAQRVQWLQENPEKIAERYRSGEFRDLDLIRQYGVIVDWGSGALFPETTRQFRELIYKRAVANWQPV